jgi:putative transposase
MRLSDEEFERLFLSLGLAQEARDYANRIRNSEPVRLVRSGKKNVKGRYSSRKMCLTIQFESHTCELPYIIDIEYNQEDVLEYYDQPDTYAIEFKNRNNRNVRPTYTPDFFVIRKTGMEFVECKTEEELLKLANEQPWKYGKWHCPPAEKHAERYGFRHVVVSTAEFDRTHIRNTVFLEDYLDEDTPPVAEDILQKVVAIISNEPGISLSNLLERVFDAGATADDVYTMIATGDIYVDLSFEPLVNRERVWVYPSKEAADANAPDAQHSLLPKGQFVDVEVGSRLVWNNKIIDIVHVGANKIFFDGEKGAAPCLSLPFFEELVKKGEIRAVKKDRDDEQPDLRWKKELDDATEKAKAEAQRRHRIIQDYQPGDPLPKKCSLRSIMRWRSRYRSAEINFGNGLVGLLPKWYLRGDRGTERIDPVARSIMNDLIENDYEKNVQKGMYVVWSKLVLECEELSGSHKIKPPVYMTFIRYVKQRPTYLQALKRMGHRAAYANAPFYYWLKKDTPPHGDRPWHICHIDHTELDIELVDPENGENLGRPWATFMVDAFCRRILAVYVTYDPPSRVSDMMVIRECVRRHGRLPQVFVVDGGSDFHSIYFETLAAAFQITIKTRPAAKPRFGTPVERLFNTTNKQLIHNLIGNTQITTNVRQITKSNDPRKLAVWTLGPLFEKLCDWGYYRYDTQKHQKLKRSPRDAYHSSLKLTGERRHRLIAYDEEFKILTLPPTRKGTAKFFPGRGVKVNNKWYWCDEFGETEYAKYEGTQIPVRMDPFNVGHVYVYLDNRWVECKSQYYFEQEGRSETEQMIISAEERMRDRQFSREMPKRAAEAARQRRADEAIEKALAENRRLALKKQDENQKVLNAINGGEGGHFFSPEKRSGNGSTDKESTNNSTQKTSRFAQIDTTSLGRLGEFKG